MNSGVIFSLLVLWFDLCVVVNVMLEMYGIEWIDDWVIGGVLLVSLVVYCVVLLFFEVWVVCMCGFVFGDEQQQVFDWFVYGLFDQEIVSVLCMLLYKVGYYICLFEKFFNVQNCVQFVYFVVWWLLF